MEILAEEFSASGHQVKVVTQVAIELERNQRLRGRALADREIVRAIVALVRCLPLRKCKSCAACRQ